MGKIIFLYGFVFSLVSVFTDFIIKTSQIEKWGTFPVFFSARLVYFLRVCDFSYRPYKHDSFGELFQILDGKKNKNSVFLIGMLIFAGLNFIFNVMLPVFLEDYRFYQLGNYSAFFFLVLPPRRSQAKIIQRKSCFGRYFCRFVYSLVHSGYCSIHTSIYFANFNSKRGYPHRFFEFRNLAYQECSHGNSRSRKN